MYGSSSSGQMSSGLLRYRSAPTSLLGQLCEDLIPGRPTSPETDSLLARFLSSDLAVVDEIQEQKNIILPPPAPSSAQLPPPPPPSSSSSQQQQQQMMTYQQQQIQSQMGMDSDQMKNSCSLIRHSSSPAGLFDHNGYGSMEGYPLTSWDDLSDNNFSSSSGFKRQKTEPQPQSEAKIGLNHQFSLPKTSSSEMAAIDKLLQFQDSVPCRIRAKRGCATHPRSIAERMRRTRISERMRKLQELVPNMDKQTNTADMLDLAVDYIKDLQKQAKTLSDNRASCTCSGSKQRP